MGYFIVVDVRRTTYHVMVHCLPFMILFATHLSYGFSLKPVFCKVPRKSLYHSKAERMYPYRALRSCRYKVFPFSENTKGMYFGFTLQSISTILPVSFSNVKSGMSALSYAPTTSALATSHSSITLMARVIMSASVDTVGEAASSFVKCIR